MKKSIVMSTALLVFVTLGSIQINAQKTKNDPKTDRVPLKKMEGTKVSEQAKAHFIADFGNIPDVQWKRSVNFDEAVFTKNGKQMTAWYDFGENLVGTTAKVSFADVPANGREAIKAKYKDYTAETVIYFDDNEVNETDMILYNQQFDDADNYFVELVKVNSKIVVRVNTRGEIFFFKQL
jgi:hypothetical protein